MMDYSAWGPADWAVVIIVFGAVFKLAAALLLDVGQWLLGNIGILCSRIYKLGRGPMTRDEFIAISMAQAGITDFRVDGERVFWGGGVDHVLPCQCGDDDCRGWAMVPETSIGMHLLQNGPDEGRPTYEQAIAMDRQARARRKEE